MSGPWLAPAKGTLDERLVGGKLARQRDMQARGLRVPPFFCLTVHAYVGFFTRVETKVRAALRTIDFADAASVRAGARAIHDAFVAEPLSDAERTRILRAFDDAFTRDAKVAVRASTVGHRREDSEDSETNPFAGMSETFLFVSRDGVPDAARAAWASGFSEQSLVYRHAEGLDLTGFGVAVGVQAMITGERSFVLFTSNPKTATRETVIVAGYGAGEGVGQERVGVDHYFVRGGRVVRREVTAKSERLVFDRARGEGLVTEPISEPAALEPCLSEGELLELASLGAKVEKIFGRPQDIEGTIDAAGTVHLLQARPIAFDYPAMRVFTNANVTESFPGATTALTFTFARFFYRVIFWDCYRRLGIPLRGLHENFDALDRMLGFLGGRVYYNLSSFYHLHAQSPLFPLFRASWEKMMGFRSSYETRPPGVLARLLDFIALTARTGVAAVVVLFRFFTHDRSMTRFFSWWESLVGPHRGPALSARSPLALMAEFQRVWTEVGREWGVTLLNDTYLPMFYNATEKLFERWKLADDASLMSDLLCGDEEIVSVEIVYSAVRLAETVAKNDALRRAFEEEEPKVLYDRLDRGELDSTFTAAFHEHVARYGDRGLQELKMEQPNLRHDPAALVRAVAGYVAAGVSERAMRDAERSVRAAAEERLAARLRGAPLKRAIASYLLSNVRRLIRHRENSRYCRSELFGFSKNVFRALGAHLEQRGALVAAADVVHLTQDEIFGYFDGTGVTDNLRALVDIRKGELATHAGMETPIEITTQGAVRDHALGAPPSAVSDPSERTLRGLGSSAGRVRGRARVVLDPGAIAKLPADTVLVARETDPGWLFLMLAAKAIVVERGSMLSHTAITGRKFGIPTVVSVADATKRIPDGALVEVDGATGTVTLLEVGAPADGEAA